MYETPANVYLSLALDKYLLRFVSNKCFLNFFRSLRSVLCFYWKNKYRKNAQTPRQTEEK